MSKRGMDSSSQHYTDGAKRRRGDRIEDLGLDPKIKKRLLLDTVRSDEQTFNWQGIDHLTSEQLKTAVGLWYCSVQSDVIDLTEQKEHDRGVAKKAPEKANSQRIGKVIEHILKSTQSSYTAKIKAIRKEFAAFVAAQKELELPVEGCLLSKDQVEVLLDNYRFRSDGWRLQNLLVAICVQPWAVDVHLGGCGVCYYGGTGLENRTNVHSNIEKVCDLQKHQSSFGG